MAAHSRVISLGNWSSRDQNRPFCCQRNCRSPPFYCDDVSTMRAQLRPHAIDTTGRLHCSICSQCRLLLLPSSTSILGKENNPLSNPHTNNISIDDDNIANPRCPDYPHTSSTPCLSPQSVADVSHHPTVSHGLGRRIHGM